MKRIYAAFFVIFIFPLIFPIFVHAESVVTVSYDDFNEYMKEVMNLNINVNQNVWNGIVTTFEQHPDYKLACSKMGSSTRYYIIINGSMYLDGNGHIVLPERSVAIYADTNASTVVNPQTLNFSGDTFFASLEDFNSFFVNIDYDNPIFSSSIPTPDMTVTYVGIGLTLPTNQNGVYVDCIVPESDAFYVQLQAKYSVADMVQINLNNGVISYDYLDWWEGDSIDIYSMTDNQSSVHVTASDFQSSWNTVINSLVSNSSFPQFTSNVPFWVQNPYAQKYLDAQDRYKNVLMRQAPLYGSRMELFARFYAIVGESVYVGKWIHWNSANPSNTEELGNSYQQDQPFPGYQNTSTNNDLPDQDDTYTNIGESTNVNQNPYTQVIVNNNVPNYPDYPTVATYNHDNILVKFITTANSLPNFFGEFGEFLTASFSFIKPEIWAIIGFGFMCSIVVMIIKIL